MKENILNIEKEMNRLREYIGDVDFCRRKIEQIDAETDMYKGNKKMNIITILTSVFVLMCVIWKMKEVIMGVGIALGIIAAICFLFTKVRSGYYYCYCFLELGVIAAGIYEFAGFGSLERAYAYPVLSVILLIVLQGFTIFGNAKLKKRIDMIAKELDNMI